MSLSRFCYLGLALPLFAACSANGAAGSPLKITAPLEGEYLGSSRVHVTGFARGLSPVFVNGVQATLSGNQFTADVELPEGAGRIKVDAEEFSDERDITVDLTPPTIELEGPTDQFITGGPVHLKGRVTDTNPVKVLVNGRAYDVDENGAFDILQDVSEGSTRLRVTARDAAENTRSSFKSVIRGRFASLGQRIPSAATLTLTPETLNELSRGGSDILSDTDFDETLRDLNPIFDNVVKINIAYENHGVVNFTLTPSGNTLYAELGISQLEVGVEADTPVLDVSGFASARDIVINAPISFAVENGKLNVDMMGADATLRDFMFTIDPLPVEISGVEQIQEVAEREVQRALKRAVRKILPKYLAEALTSMLPADIAIGDKTVHIAPAINTIAVSDSGLFISMDITPDAPKSTPEQFPGYFAVGAWDEPQSTSPATLNLALDALNASSTAAWAAGMFNQRLDNLELFGQPLTFGQFKLVIAPHMENIVPLTTPLILELDANLPPVISAEEQTVRFSESDLRVRILAKVSETEEMQIATLSINLDAPIHGGIAGANPIELDLAQLHVTADPIDAPDSFPTSEELDSVGAALVGPFVEDFFATGTLSLPSIYGFDITPDSLAMSGGYMSLSASLHYAGPAAVTQ